MNKIKFNIENCTLCENCINSCPTDIIQKIKKVNNIYYPDIIDMKKCFQCRMCIQICPESCVEFIKDDKK